MPGERSERLWHLTGRFLGMLAPLGPSRSRDEWARSQLLPGECELWNRMKRADRRHAVAVALRARESLGDGATRPVMAAALLHDVGKIDSGLGVYGRVVATLSGAAVGRDPETIHAWTRSRGITRRVGLYLSHPELGGNLLALAGSAPLTEAWAREHHLPADRWTVPVEVGSALKAADDD